MINSKAESNAIVPLGGKSVAMAAKNPKVETKRPVRQE
jgi:hypothetical protein